MQAADCELNSKLETRIKNLPEIYDDEAFAKSVFKSGSFSPGTAAVLIFLADPLSGLDSFGNLIRLWGVHRVASSLSGLSWFLNSERACVDAAAVIFVFVCVRYCCLISLLKRSLERALCYLLFFTLVCLY